MNTDQAVALIMKMGQLIAEMTSFLEAMVPNLPMEWQAMAEHLVKKSDDLLLTSSADSNWLSRTQES